MQCMKNPVPIGVGYLAQYIVKPLLGFCIAKVLLIPSPSTVGQHGITPLTTPANLRCSSC